MVKANETNLEGILEGKRQYQVPLYQRVYSWGPKQIDQLWDDLMEIAEARRAGGTPTHFIGSLVLAASPDNGVVGVHIQIAVGVNDEVELTVASEEGQEVVQRAEAGPDITRPAAVEAERERDRCLGRPALDRGTALRHER